MLCNEAKKAAYLGGLGKGAGANPIDVASLLEAERIFAGAAALVRARRFKEAIPELDRAIALNDAEGEFFAWRAFARFSSTPDKRLVERQTQEELELAIQKSPNCVVAFLFSARVATVLGDVPGAIKYYKRCLAQEPDHLEAKRELRLLETRNLK
ncbi:hypothetical protein [Vulgatibacter incomptus]|uniref:Antifreeze glycopeptide AFGP polyprotein n=1 Tax=Vulgatibacter incomptus TaxID=1391653 RepID=A0A0K1P9I8_9BACT|nr:hypothetical protein [Vulgatibacter incomptus]AKU89754.1 Antifreeze glycopeptide AFGP polyprotein precursor [Vulgatibacter incomptus]